MKAISKWLNDASIRWKLILVFIFMIILILTVNIFMYMNINKITMQLDEIYTNNVQLNAISDELGLVQESMTSYLNTKTTDAMESYYEHEQNYSQLISNLESRTTGNSLKLMERNIRYMSESYLLLTSWTIDAKRGRNVEKYKLYYEQASQTYEYLSAYILSLNNELFRNNSTTYATLANSLQYLETISLVIFVVVGIFTVLLIVGVTSSITRPLQDLSNAANQVANGELYQVEVVPVHAMDEIGVVTLAFNQMVISIREYIGRIKKSMEKEQEMREKELRMETHLKDAQLKYLQAQINPHFLFNTLNAGAQLAMMEEADRTYAYIQNVADFFRYNIKKDNDIVTIEDEIHLVDNYIYILNVRFSGEIHFEKEIDESLLATKIPGMILQPIVENSVNYGIRNIDWEGHIKLSVSKKDENICIAISDNGVGISTDRIDAIMHNQGVMDNVESERTDSNGVGLTNVMERLRLFFGGRDCFEITSDGKNQGTLVTITIPGQ